MGRHLKTALRAVFAHLLGALAFYLRLALKDGATRRLRAPPGVCLLSSWGRLVEPALRAASRTSSSKPSAWNLVLGGLRRNHLSLVDGLLTLMSTAARERVAGLPTACKRLESTLARLKEKIDFKIKSKQIVASLGLNR